MKPLTVLFACVYALLKRPLEKLLPKNALLKLLFQTIIVLLTVFLMCFIFTALMPFMGLKFCVYVYLKLKYREKFGGFLSIFDSQFIFPGRPCFIHVALVIEEQGNIDAFFQELKQSIKKMHDSVYHLGSLVRYTFGYPHYIKSQVTSDEILSKVTLNDREFITKEELLEYTNKMRPMNKLWCVNLFKQPLLADDFKSKNKFVVLLNINHCLVDGYNFILLLDKFLFDTSAKMHRTDSKFKLVKPRFSLENCYLTDRKIVKLGLPGSKNQVNVVYNEEYSENYPEKIKRICKRYKVGYTDVITTAFLRALSWFLYKKKSKFLEQVQIFIPTRSDLKDVENMLSECISTPEMTNKLHFQSFPSPLLIENESSLGELLLKTSEKYEFAKKSLDGMFSYSLLEYIFGFLPLMFYKRVVYRQFDHSILGFSNVANHKERYILGRRVIKVFTIISVIQDIGMFVIFMTYNGKLQITFMSKQAFIESVHEGKEILNKVLENIDLLAEEKTT